MLSSVLLLLLSLLLIPLCFDCLTTFSYSTTAVSLSASCFCFVAVAVVAVALLVAVAAHVLVLAGAGGLFHCSVVLVSLGLLMCGKPANVPNVTRLACLLTSFLPPSSKFANLL